MIDEKQRKAADAQFKKTERATEGVKAMADYKAEGEAERAKTVRLRAQRLAKEGGRQEEEINDATGGQGFSLGEDGDMPYKFKIGTVLLMERQRLRANASSSAACKRWTEFAAESILASFEWSQAIFEDDLAPLVNRPKE